MHPHGVERVVARPLRFRYSPQSWSDRRVKHDILQPLQSNIGAQEVSPWFKSGGDWQTHRFEMQNGDIALFARTDSDAYWMGNTETPSALWKTDKFGWREVPYHVSRWAQRELIATLHEEDPWLADYPHLSWFFLPVFMSKDGRGSTRSFFREHAGGFPDAGRRETTRFFEDFLQTGVLDEYRHVMSGKLGTSDHVDRVRMSAAMAEFIAAKSSPTRATTSSRRSRSRPDTRWTSGPKTTTPTSSSRSRARNRRGTAPRPVPSPPSATPPRPRPTANWPNTAAVPSSSSTARVSETTPGLRFGANSPTFATAPPSSIASGRTATSKATRRAQCPSN